jgi:PTS system mannitol-specific IIC component
MKPIMILAAIGGGMAGILTLVITGAGLRSPAAPGSILAVYAATASDSYVGVTLSVLLATAVSFLIGSVILKTTEPGRRRRQPQQRHQPGWKASRAARARSPV